MQMIKLKTKNDVNGNPRRVFILLDGYRIIQAWDQGYSGHHAVPEEYRSMAYDAPAFFTTPGQYREVLKHYSK
jgi:hypothetical protein